MCGKRREHHLGRIQLIALDSGQSPAVTGKWSRSPRPRTASIGHTDRLSQERENRRYGTVPGKSAYMERPAIGEVYQTFPGGSDRETSANSLIGSFRELACFFALRDASASRPTPHRFGIAFRCFIILRLHAAYPWFCHEKNVSAKGPETEAETRLSSSDARPGWSCHPQIATAKRPETSRRLIWSLFAPGTSSAGFSAREDDIAPEGS